MTHATLTQVSRVRRLRPVRVSARTSRSDPKERARRFVNVTIAALALILTAPVMIVLAALVKLSSPGPVFFTQTRVGIDRRRDVDGPHRSRRRADKGGRLFTIYKFRTMCVNDSDETWAQLDDPRVTNVGRFLRKFRLDELPQLFNVLQGDMNIVGPRPEQPKIFARLRDEIEHYPRRQRVRPGITGWAQINQHYDRSIADVRRKVEFDLEYVERQSLIQDLSIMARTIPVMIFQKGAY